MSTTTEIAKIQLADTSKGEITIATITNPYGEGSHTVASIGISLDGKEIEWKTHIPLENIDAVCAALQKAKH